MTEGLTHCKRTASEELPVFDRDYSDKMLNVVPYFLAQVLNSGLFALITPVLFSVPYYYIVSFRPGFEYFLWFCVILGVLQVRFFFNTLILTKFLTVKNSMPWKVSLFFVFA